MKPKRNTENEVAVSSTGAVPPRRKASPRVRAHAPATEREPAPTSSVETPADYEPTHEEISLLAYLYWEERGCQGGSPEEDWLRAEQELKARLAAVATA